MESGTSTVTATYGLAMPNINVPKKTGYEFTGYWTHKDSQGDKYYKADGTGEKSWDIAQATTLYAGWSAITWTVSFDANGGQFPTGTQLDNGMFKVAVVYQKPTVDDSVSSVPQPTMAGYNFTGWSKSKTDNQHFSTSDDITGDITVYAYWEKPSYNVLFRANFGDGSMQPLKVEEGQSVNLTPNAFTKTGYTFSGWNTKIDGTGNTYNDGASITMGNADIELFAQWNANEYTVALDNQGGGSSPDEVIATYNEVLPKVTPPTRTGYIFGGYYTEPQGNGDNYLDGDGNPTAKKWEDTKGGTLYAKWTAKTYTVTLNDNGGSGGAGNVTATFGETLPQATPIPTLSGWTFDGYYTQNGLEQYYNPAGSGVKPWDKDADTTLYAQWTQNNVLSYDGNGADGGLAPAAGQSPPNVTTPTTVAANTFTKTGYTFIEWNTQADGSGASYAPNDTYQLNASQVLYAQWNANEYKVTFNGNGATGGSTTDQTFTYDAAAQLRDNGFTRTDYLFCGWATSASGEIAYKNKESVSNLTANPNDTVPLYAVWREAPVIIGNDIIYAKGTALVIVGNSDTETTVYIDENRNGAKDAKEPSLADTGMNFPDNSNLSGYTFYGGAQSGTIYGDTLITIRGGCVKSIIGSGGSGTNINGTAQVNLYGGKVSEDVYGEKDGTADVKAVNVQGSPVVGNESAQKGIVLSSITNSTATISGPIGDSANVCLIGTNGEGGTVVAVANAASYIRSEKFTLIAPDPDNNNTVGKVSLCPEVLNLIVTGAIRLPADTGIYNVGGFKLGTARITVNGTIFSVFVDKGHFTVENASLNGASFNMGIPKTPQPSDPKQGYVTQLAVGRELTYMQFVSTGGNISKTDVQDYLNNMVKFFPETGKSIKISVNIETVSFDTIASSGVTYFNGSFYNVVDLGKTKANWIAWTDAYNAAKQTSFNGLKGYLIAITSEAENKFIYDQMFTAKGVSASDAKGWIGGTRMTNGNSATDKSGFDADTWTKTYADGNTNASSYNKWYWICGPEAYEAKMNNSNANHFYTGREYDEAGASVVNGMYEYWNRKSSPWSRPHSDSDEPNNWFVTNQNQHKPDQPNYQEDCIQYVGTYIWNDLPHFKAIPGMSGNENGQQYYIIEYTPYGPYLASQEAKSNSVVYGSGN